MSVAQSYCINLSASDRSASGLSVRSAQYPYISSHSNSESELVNSSTLSHGRVAPWRYWCHCIARYRNGGNARRRADEHEESTRIDRLGSCLPIETRAQLRRHRGRIALRTTVRSSCSNASANCSNSFAVMPIALPRSRHRAIALSTADRKSTRLNSSHHRLSRMPSSA